MRAWLHDRNVTLEERDFFQKPFSDAELRDIIGVRPASDLFSWKSPSFKALGLSPGSLDAEALIRLMLREPRLIRRPIVRIGDRLIIGADWPALEAALR